MKGKGGVGWGGGRRLIPLWCKDLNILPPALRYPGQPSIPSTRPGGTPPAPALGVLCPSSALYSHSPFSDPFSAVPLPRPALPCALLLVSVYLFQCARFQISISIGLPGIKNGPERILRRSSYVLFSTPIYHPSPSLIQSIRVSVSRLSL